MISSEESKRERYLADAPLAVEYSASEHGRAEDRKEGFCSDCQAFTRDCTESDAESLNCPLCFSDSSVYGATRAWELGLLEVVDD